MKGLTIIQLGIEIVIKVKNITSTIFLSEHWRSKIAHVFVNQNFCRFMNVFKISFYDQITFLSAF